MCLIPIGHILFVEVLPLILCTHTQTFMYTHTCMLTHTMHAHIYVCTHAPTHTQLCTHTHTHTHASRVYTHLRAHTHVHTHQGITFVVQTQGGKCSSGNGEDADSGRGRPLAQHPANAGPPLRVTSRI